MEPLPKNVGGPSTHKPGCKCRPCSARRRKEEAGPSLPGGDGGDAWGLIPVQSPKIPQEHKVDQSLIEADLPPIIAQGRTIRDRVMQWVALKHKEPGISNVEVAKRLGISSTTLQAYLWRAGKEGWLKFDDPMSRVEYEIIPKVLDGLNSLLDAKDSKAIIESAKATIFKQYELSKGAKDAPTTIIALKIETGPNPVPSQPVQVAIEGQIVGVPRMLQDRVDPEDKT